MNLFMHRVMAKEILARLENEWGIILSSPTFILGSLYPDVSHKIFTKRHFAGDSLEITKQGIMRLCGGRPDITTKLFALRLGEITHYICDYFCYTHSPAFTGTFSQHVRYEKYQRCQWKWFKARGGSHTPDLLGVADSRTAAEILDYINTELQSYESSLGSLREEQLDDVPRAISVASLAAAAVCRLGMAFMPIPAPSKVIPPGEARRLLGIPELESSTQAP